jgi:hypothetical protein
MPFADPRLPAPSARLPLFVAPSASSSSTSELRPSPIELSLLPNSSNPPSDRITGHSPYTQDAVPGSLFITTFTIEHHPPTLVWLISSLAVTALRAFASIHRLGQKGLLPFQHLLIPI